MDAGLAMTPAAAVARLAALMAEHADFTEDSLHEAMAQDGIPAPVADLAFKFTQIAWGRVFLDGLGVRFSPDYQRVDGAGNVFESGRLAEQPYFIAALAAARAAAGAPEVARLALMSAEVDAVNKALNAGSKPENLVTATAILFSEPPTAAGMEEGKRAIASSLPSPKKPWWRVW